MSSDQSISKWRLSEILIPMLISDHWYFIGGSIRLSLNIWVIKTKPWATSVVKTCLTLLKIHKYGAYPGAGLSR